MTRIQYQPLKLNQTNRYSGYQFYSRVRVDGLEPFEAFKFLILSVYEWMLMKMPEEDRKVPELQLPEAERYADLTKEDFKPYHLSIGYALDITPLMESGIWTMRIKEPDGGLKDRRDPVPGRFFTTRVGLRLNNRGYTEMGIRIDVTDPASEEKELDFAFRPGFVRTLAVQSSVHFEQIRDMKYRHAVMVDTDEEYKQLLYMLDNEENQLPLVVFTYFRPGKKTTPASIDDIMKDDPLRTLLSPSVIGSGSLVFRDRPLKYTMPAMPGSVSGKKTDMPPRTVKVLPAAAAPARMAAKHDDASETAGEEQPVMPYDVESFSGSAFAYALMYVLGDRYLEKLQARLKKEFYPGDILVIGARKFRGGISVTGWQGEKEEEREKPYKEALLAAQCYSKHKEPYSFGTVIFEAEARKLEQHARVTELVNSGTIEEKDKVVQLMYEMEMLFGVIDDKEEDIRRLNGQVSEAFDRGMTAASDEIDKLEDTIDDLRQKLISRQALIDTMKNSYDQTSLLGEALDQMRTINALPENNDDVVRFFRAAYRDRLDFTERGASTASRCDIRPANMWRILYTVAHQLVDVFRNAHDNLTEEDVMKATGYVMSFREGSMTRERKDMMRLREDEYQGRKISIEPHLKLKTGKGETANQRLHFWYDPDMRRIVIGYLGEHMESASSRYVK